MSSYNDRIFAKREKTAIDFVETTSTNLTTAKHYLKQTAFDLERAVSLFYDTGGEALEEKEEDNNLEDEHIDDENMPSNSNTEEESNNSTDPISAIMAAAKKESSNPSSSFSGKGYALNDDDESNRNSLSSEELKVRVVFYKDGFTVQEEATEEADTTTNPRRRGIHSFASSKSSSSIKLPPLRNYDENEEFMNDIQKSRVPVEFRRLDSNKKPIQVSILLDDRRPGEYPLEQWNTQQREPNNDNSKRSSSFHGEGRTLGGNNTTTTPSVKTNNNKNLMENFVAWCYALLVSFFGNILLWFYKVRPEEKHIVDSTKPTTTISLRHNNKREKVEFNTDHTIEDLYRYCRIELGSTTNFQLLAGFPLQTISSSDTTTTLKEAGLLNSAVEIRIMFHSKN